MKRQRSSEEDRKKSGRGLERECETEPNNAVRQGERQREIGELEQSLMLILSCAVVWRTATGRGQKLKAPLVEQKSLELERKRRILFQVDRKRGIKCNYKVLAVTMVRSEWTRGPHPLSPFSDLQNLPLGDPRVLCA